MESIINMIENISNRSYIAIILVIAAMVLLVVTWAWMFSLQKKLTEAEREIDALKGEMWRNRKRGE